MPDQIIERIRAAYAGCRDRYPTVDLPFEEFLARIQTILVPGRERGGPGSADGQARLAAFEKLHHADLYLALACARGHRIAWEHFADDFVPALRRMAVQACRNLEEGEDLAQEIVAGLLGAAHDADSVLGGKLAGYEARASLMGWLRVVVAHAAIDRARRRKRETSLDEMPDEGESPVAIAARPPAPTDAESLDARWGPVLLEELKGALQRLPATDRMALALYYVDEVPLRQIGRHFGLHEATASRWLDRLRKEIRRAVERACRTRHRLRPREVKQLWHWISGDEPLSLSQVLGVEPGESRLQSKGLQDPQGRSSMS